MIQWNKTTEAEYSRSLGVLPPASYGANGSFQVGEPFSHRNGEPTFASFKVMFGEYYQSDEPLTFDEFREEVGDAEYYYEG
jgi:hypothetical protein